MPDVLISELKFGSDVYTFKDKNAAHTSDLNGKIDSSEKGAANGVAELDSAGKVPSSQLPSYVDDVLEFDSKDFSNWSAWVSGTSYAVGDEVTESSNGYICKTANSSATFDPSEWDEATKFPTTGESGKIYVAKDNNNVYRWSGSTYINITSSSGDLDSKADKNNTVLTGSLSLGRKDDTFTGTNSSAIGTNVTASGKDSHAEGYDTTASGLSSHAEGYNTIASGIYSHAEGSNTEALGYGSHAGGYVTEAGNYCTFAHGEKLKVYGEAAFAFGKYNVQDIPDWVSGTSYNVGDYVVNSDKYVCKCKNANSDIEFTESNWSINTNTFTSAEIIGGGNSSNRKNIRTLDWNGNERLKGTLYVEANDDGSGGSAVAKASDAIKNITRSGVTFTATKADGTTFTFTQQDNNTTYTAGSGINIIDNAISLKTTTIASNSDLNTLNTPGFYECTSVTIASSLSNCPTTTNFTMIVMKKGSYIEQVIFSGGSNVVWTRYQTSGGFGDWATFTDASKAIDTITRSGTTFTATKADGTTFTFTQQDNNTTYGNFTAATSAANGTAGLVPAPAKGKQASFLRGDATWVVPTNTTYGMATTATAGLVSTDDQQFAGQKWFRHRNIKIGDVSNSRYHEVYFMHNAGSYNGYIRMDGGHTANQTLNQFSFASYAPKSTADAGNSGFREIYSLPAPAAGLTADKSYGIWTSKDFGNATTAARGLITTENQSFKGIKTFVNYIMVDRSGESLTAGTQYNALSVKFDNSDNSATYNSPPIRFVGNTETGSVNNAPIALGSISGSTLISAGENAGKFYTANTALINTENINLACDGTISLYPGLSSDGSITGKYAFPSITVTADMSKAIKSITRSGTTFTATMMDGTTTTFNQQDNNTTYSFSNGNPTLAWNTTSTVGTVGGVALTVKMPANPNTNTTYSFSNGNPTLAWNTTSTVGTVGGVNLTVKMPANPNTNTTYADFTAATSAAAGAHGLVPAPAKGKQASFLRGDATWVVPTNTTYAAATTAANGLMSTGAQDFAGEKWFVNQLKVGKSSISRYHNISFCHNSDSNYNGLISMDSGHTANQTNNRFGFFEYSPNTTNNANNSGFREIYYLPAPAAGLTVDKSYNIYTSKNLGAFTAATSAAAGAAGLVPAPAAGAQAKFLRGDKTWATPTNTTYADFTAATSAAAGTHGLVPAPAKNKQTSFLRGDATWALPLTTTLLGTANTLDVAATLSDSTSNYTLLLIKEYSSNVLCGSIITDLRESSITINPGVSAYAVTITFPTTNSVKITSKGSSVGSVIVYGIGDRT